MRALCDYSWPGNVRQLKNCMERLVVTVEGTTIHLEDLPNEMHAVRHKPAVESWPANVIETAKPEVQPLEIAVAEVEKATILAALEAVQPPPRTDRATAWHQRADLALQDEPLQPAIASAGVFLQEIADMQLLAGHRQRAQGFSACSCREA